MYTNSMEKEHNYLLVFVLKIISLALTYVAMTPLSFMLFAVVSFSAITFINISAPYETTLTENTFVGTLSFSLDEEDILHYFLIANAVILLVKKLIFPHVDSPRTVRKKFYKDTSFILITILYILATVTALTPIARPGAESILGILFIFWIMGIVMSTLYRFLMRIVEIIESVSQSLSA